MAERLLRGSIVHAAYEDGSCWPSVVTVIQPGDVVDVTVLTIGTGSESNLAPNPDGGKGTWHWPWACRDEPDCSDGRITGEAIYQAWHGTDEPWGGCADRAAVERVLALIERGGAGAELAGPRDAGRPEWDPYFLTLAETVSLRADCRRRRVGCIIVDAGHRVVSTGYNGAPAGDPGCLSGACPRGLLSYEQVKGMTNYDTGPGQCISLHAEANALLYAGREVRGCTAYITDLPCPTCTKLLRGAGIDRVVTPAGVVHFGRAA